MIKKYVLFTISALMLLAPGASAKGLPAFFKVLERAVIVSNGPFANERVKRMCKQWPTCEKWARNKAQKDPSFTVIDAEVERWVDRWEDKKSIWEYRFYLQTQENGQTKAYKFEQEGPSVYAALPVAIQRFPGHPIARQPSKEVFIRRETPDRGHYPYYESLCASWTGCNEWAKDYNIYRAIVSQYIYKWDKAGYALWKRRLYVKGIRFFHTQNVYFQMYQIRAGGEYISQPPVKINSCPTYPEVP